MCEESSVAVGLTMVGFVDDDVVVVIGRELGEQAFKPRVEHGDGDKQMGVVGFGLRRLITHPQRTEIGVLQHAAVGVQRLTKDFLAMGGKFLSLTLLTGF